MECDGGLQWWGSHVIDCLGAWQHPLLSGVALSWFYEANGFSADLHPRDHEPACPRLRGQDTSSCVSASVWSGHYQTGAPGPRWPLWPHLSTESRDTSPSQAWMMWATWCPVSGSGPSPRPTSLCSPASASFVLLRSVTASRRIWRSASVGIRVSRLRCPR